jgi:hypothetical protein
VVLRERGRSLAVPGSAPFRTDRWRGDGAKMARKSSANFRRSVIVGRRAPIARDGVTCGVMALGGS